MIIPRYSVEIRIKEIFTFLSGAKKVNKLNNENILLFNSGSEAIVHYLNCIRKDRKLEVGIPLYCCSSVYESVLASQNNIHFLDIGLGKSGYIFDDSTFKELDVLIFIHYFGLHYEGIHELRSKFQDLIIIEDCAHLSITGYTPNKFSNISIFSFNLHKPISAGSGGAIVFNNEPDKSLIKRSYIDLTAINRKSCIWNFIKVIVKSYGFTPIIYSLIIGILERKRLNSNFKINTNIKPKKICFTAINIIENKIDNQSEKIINNYFKISEKFIFNYELLHKGELHYFPLFFSDSVTRNKVKSILNKSGVDSFILWENTLYNSNRFGLTNYNEFKNSLEMLGTILFLPSLLFRKKHKLNKISKLIDDIHY